MNEEKYNKSIPIYREITELDRVLDAAYLTIEYKYVLQKASYMPSFEWKTDTFIPSEEVRQRIISVLKERLEELKEELEKL